MKLQFKRFDSPLPERTKLYLKCPKCEQIGLWRGYPSNPVLSTVECAHCGFESMGNSFQKAIVKIKKPTEKEIRSLLKSHKQFTTGVMEEEQHRQFIQVIDIIYENRPLMRVLRAVSENSLNDEDMALVRKGRRWALIGKKADDYFLTHTGKKVLAEASDFGHA